jgi:hypothetical protein
MFSQVTCDVFVVHTKLAGNILFISLETDLPNNTDLMVGVSRQYWKKGSSEIYAQFYHSEKSNVEKWKKQQNIKIDNAEWEQELKENSENPGWNMPSYEVDKISQKINISMTVPINQSNTKFGNVNSKLKGKKVKSPYGFPIIDETINIFYSLD